MNCYYCKSKLQKSWISNRYYCVKCSASNKHKCLVALDQGKISLIELASRFDKLYIVATSTKKYGMFFTISTLDEKNRNKDIISYFRYSDFINDFAIIDKKIQNIANIKGFL